jgi:hypothetical protein
MAVLGDARGACQTLEAKAGAVAQLSWAMMCAKLSSCNQSIKRPSTSSLLIPLYGGQRVDVAAGGWWSW